MESCFKRKVQYRNEAGGGAKVGQNWHDVDGSISRITRVLTNVKEALPGLETLWHHNRKIVFSKPPRKTLLAPLAHDSGIPLVACA